jgi:hypothetical protein
MTSPPKTTAVPTPQLPSLAEALIRHEKTFSFITQQRQQGTKRKHVLFEDSPMNGPNNTPTTNLLDNPEDIADEKERTELIYTLLAIRYITKPCTCREAMNSDHAKE